MLVRFRTKIEQQETCKRLSPSSQGQNLAVTVLSVPDSLGRGSQQEEGILSSVSSGSNVIPRRARPGLAGLQGYLANKKQRPSRTLL